MSWAIKKTTTQPSEGCQLCVCNAALQPWHASSRYSLHLPQPLHCLLSSDALVFLGLAMKQPWPWSLEFSHSTNCFQHISMPAAFYAQDPHHWYSASWPDSPLLPLILLLFSYLGTAVPAAHCSLGVRAGVLCHGFEQACRPSLTASSVLAPSLNKAWSGGIGGLEWGRRGSNPFDVLSYHPTYSAEGFLHAGLLGNNLLFLQQLSYYSCV